MQLVTGLRAGMPDDQGLTSPEAATQAVQVAVTGKRASVTVTTAQASEGGEASISADQPTPPESKFLTRSRPIGAFPAGLATVTALIEFH